MRDILPDEIELRDSAVREIVGVYRAYGFRRIETPALESLRLLAGSEGGENEKLIFKVMKRGDELEGARRAGDELADLGLRFDLTVPLARYYADNHARLPEPLKAIQIGPVWRAERPQKGRFRQFTQCDIDILGVSSEIAEIELILATAEALLALGLTDITIRINDRRILAAIARHCGFAEGRFDSVFIALDKLDKIDKAGVVKELEAEGHAPKAIGELMRLLEDAGVLSHFLASGAEPAAWQGLQRIITTLAAAAGGGVRIAVDPTLVRGMSYYTGPIFEIRYADSASSIAGGGRYDRMIGRLLGRDVPATGFSIGFERVIGILTERPATTGAETDRLAIVFAEDTPHLSTILERARDYRAQGRPVLLELKRKNLGRQLHR